MITDRAITLLQPWASLMAAGVKTIETRSRRTSYRGWVAVHSSARNPAREPLSGRLLELTRALPGPHPCPLGLLLCVVELYDCKPVEEVRRDISPDEYACGGYSNGRWAYLTRNVRRLRVPFAVRGMQSIPWKLAAPILEEHLEPLPAGVRMSRTVLNPAAAWPFPTKEAVDGRDDDDPPRHAR